jgi:hypothetical protein
VAPRAGYRQKYLELARKQVHPLNEAKEAAISFFTILNNSTDARFGLVCFDHEIASAPDGHFTMPRIANSYPQAGTEQFDFAHYTPELVNTNFNDIVGKLPTLTVRGATALFKAFNAAGQDALTLGRPNSRKVSHSLPMALILLIVTLLFVRTRLRCKNKVRLTVLVFYQSFDVTAQRTALTNLSDMVARQQTFVMARSAQKCIQQYRQRAATGRVSSVYLVRYPD